MKHNPHNFKAGDDAVLDESYNNSSVVHILYITSSGLLSCIVPVELKDSYQDGDAWDVMTNRLTLIKQKSNDTN